MLSKLLNSACVSLLMVKPHVDGALMVVGYLVDIISARDVESFHRV